MKTGNWTADEEHLVKDLMAEVIGEGNYTESKWDIVSVRLSERHQMQRSPTAVKNYWNRRGRSDWGLDERRTPNPNRMTTSTYVRQRREKRMREEEEESF